MVANLAVYLLIDRMGNTRDRANDKLDHVLGLRVRWQGEIMCQMAHKNKVMRSVNSPDGVHCVDIFVRPDGSFGFEAFRRDVEDGRGWFPVGFFGALQFDHEAEAWQTALLKVPWLEETAQKKQS